MSAYPNQPLGKSSLAGSDAVTVDKSSRFYHSSGSQSGEIPYWHCSRFHNDIRRMTSCLNTKRFLGEDYHTHGAELYRERRNAYFAASRWFCRCTGFWQRTRWFVSVRDGAKLWKALHRFISGRSDVRSPQIAFAITVAIGAKNAA